VLGGVYVWFGETRDVNELVGERNVCGLCCGEAKVVLEGLCEA